MSFESEKEQKNTQMKDWKGKNEYKSQPPNNFSPTFPRKFSENKITAKNENLYVVLFFVLTSFHLNSFRYWSLSFDWYAVLYSFSLWQKYVCNQNKTEQMSFQFFFSCTNPINRNKWCTHYTDTIQNIVLYKTSIIFFRENQLKFQIWNALISFPLKIIKSWKNSFVVVLYGTCFGHTHMLICSHSQSQPHPRPNYPNITE